MFTERIVDKTLVLGWKSVESKSRSRRPSIKIILVNIKYIIGCNEKKLSSGKQYLIRKYIDMTAFPIILKYQTDPPFSNNSNKFI